MPRLRDGCPSGVEYGRLVETARAQIRTRASCPRIAGTTRGARSVRKSTVPQPRPDARDGCSLLRFAQRTGLTSVASAIGLRDAIALAPAIPERFFEPAQRRIDAERPVGVAFLHAGCVMQFAFPKVHDATIRMLLRARLSVVIPRDQGCCGAIGVHAGEMEFGRELAKRNIAAFERSKADVYVVDAAGCGSALKEYGTLFAADPQWAERASRFSQRVRDVCEVLDASELDPAIGESTRSGHLSRTVSLSTCPARQRRSPAVVATHSGSATDRNERKRFVLRKRRNL